MAESELAKLGLLTLAQAAARGVGGSGRPVHERTLRRYTAQGLRCITVGGSERAGYLLFRADDLDAFTPPRGRGAPAGNQNAVKKPTKTRRKRESGKKSKNP